MPLPSTHPPPLTGLAGRCLYAPVLFRSLGEELWKTARKIILLKNGKPMALRQLPKSTEPAQVSIKIRLLKPHTTNPNENIRGFDVTIASAADIEQPAATKPVNGKVRSGE